MNTRKGYTLAIVLGLGILLTGSAILLFSTSRDEMRIAANNRRILQSKLAATSGLAHFKSMELFYNNLRQQADVIGQDELIIISETPLGDRTFYKVEVTYNFRARKTFFIQDRRLIIAS